MKHKLVDLAPGRGVYEGDLKYGRCQGNVPVKHKDFSASPNPMNGDATNKPLVPLQLVQPRDPDVWSSERELVKKAKKKVSQWHQSTSEWVESFQIHGKSLKANLHLTIGKQRL